jgi:hypothetical protein
MMLSELLSVYALPSTYVLASLVMLPSALRTLLVIITLNSNEVFKLVKYLFQFKSVVDNTVVSQS